MSIKITHRKDWNDHQEFICMACNKMAVMKVEVRIDSSTVNGKEWGPAQTLRLCRNHTDITYGLLQDELTEFEEQDLRQLEGDPPRIIKIRNEY